VRNVIPSQTTTKKTIHKRPSGVPINIDLIGLFFLISGVVKRQMVNMLAKNSAASALTCQVGSAISSGNGSACSVKIRYEGIIMVLPKTFFQMLQIVRIKAALSMDANNQPIAKMAKSSAKFGTGANIA
jgi:hypothetical protein